MSGPMYTPFLPVGAPTGVFTPPVWTSLAPNSSTLAWRIPWTEKPGGLQSMGSLRVGHDWAASLSLLCIGGGNGNPLQCSCLENPRDRGAWWPVIYGVARSQTRLKQLSSSSIQVIRASLIAQLVKNLPAMQETRVRFLSPGDPLEKEMATHSRTLTWRIPWTEEPGRLQSMGSHESDTT